MTKEDKNKLFAEYCGKLKDEHGPILRQMFDLVIEKAEKLEFENRYGNSEFSKLLQANEILEKNEKVLNATIKVLQVQIEKMKCCQNCKYSEEVYGEICCTVDYENNDYCSTENNDLWEMKMTEKLEFSKPCSKDCIVHQLKTHNSCLFCESLRNSPFHDVKSMSDEEIRNMQKEVEKEL